MILASIQQSCQNEQRIQTLLGYVDISFTSLYNSSQLLEITIQGLMCIDVQLSISITWFNIIWKNAIRFLSKVSSTIPTSLQDTLLHQFTYHFLQCKSEIQKELLSSPSSLTTPPFLKFFLVLFSAFIKQLPSFSLLPSFPSFFQSFLDLIQTVTFSSFLSYLGNSRKMAVFVTFFINERTISR